jgi:hypothetical protein
MTSPGAELRTGSNSDIIRKHKRSVYEGPFVSEANMCQVQGNKEKRRNTDYLREPEAQAETRLECSEK